MPTSPRYLWFASRVAIDPPETLYHYTSQQGLIGIVESRGIWATVVHYLNDGREWRHALEIAHEVVRGNDRWDEDSPVGRYLADCDMWLENMREVLVCAASFSANGDLLSQWRGYCSPGNGFAIGFNSVDLIAAATPFWSFRQCLYDRQAQENLVAEHLDAYMSRFITEASSAPPEQLVRKDRSLLRSRAWEFAINFVRVGPAIKDPAFAEEQEWRAISPAMKYKDLSVRPGPNTLIPYTSLDLSGGAGRIRVPKVVVGPTVHPELSINGVVALLFAHDIRYERISPSLVPFRPW